MRNGTFYVMYRSLTTGRLKIAATAKDIHSALKGIETLLRHPSQGDLATAYLRHSTGWSEKHTLRTIRSIR